MRNRETRDGQRCMRLVKIKGVGAGIGDTRELENKTKLVPKKIY